MSGERPPLAVVILAAGLSRRMLSSTPKVLHMLGGRPVLSYVLEQAQLLSPDRLLVVGSETLTQHPAFEALKKSVAFEGVLQPHPKGTGDGVRHAAAVLSRNFLPPPTGLEAPALQEEGEMVLVLFGDTPLLSHETLVQLLHIHRTTGSALSLLGIRPPNPQGYGRLILSESTGEVVAIREERDASEGEKALPLCNGGVMVLSGQAVGLLKEITAHNAAGEYYLTDLVALAHSRGLKVSCQEAPFEEVLGINTRADLAHATQLFQERWRARALAQGASLLDPSSTYFSFDTQVEADVVLYPHVFLDKGVRLEAGAVIYPFSVLSDTTLSPGAKVGPFCHLRGGSVVSEGAVVGNFVEMKNTLLGKKSAAKHLSYLGDACIGEDANIGAGTITCNYDGKRKNPTHIGAKAFIGSNTALIAPVSVGEGARVGAGSVITRDVPAHHLALSRPAQENHPSKETASKGAAPKRAIPKEALS